MSMCGCVLLEVCEWRGRLLHHLARASCHIAENLTNSIVSLVSHWQHPSDWWCLNATTWPHTDQLASLSVTIWLLNCTLISAGLKKSGKVFLFSKRQLRCFDNVILWLWTNSISPVVDSWGWNGLQTVKANKQINNTELLKSKRVLLTFVVSNSHIEFWTGFVGVAPTFWETRNSHLSHLVMSLQGF